MRIREISKRLQGDDNHGGAQSLSNNQMSGFFGGTRHFGSKSSSEGHFQNKGPQCAYCKCWGHIRCFFKAIKRK